MKCISVHQGSFHSCCGKVSLLGAYVGLGAQSVMKYLLLTCEQTCSIQTECHQAAVTVIWPGLYWTDMCLNCKKVTRMLYITSPCQLSWLSGTYHGCRTINRMTSKNKQASYRRKQANKPPFQFKFKGHSHNYFYFVLLDFTKIDTGPSENFACCKMPVKTFHASSCFLFI